MDLFLPARPEGPALAMMGLGHRRIGFQFADQFIVGLGLLPRQINVENEQRNQPHDGHIVRRRTYLPKLPPIHKLLLNACRRRAPFARRSSEARQVFPPTA